MISKELLSEILNTKEFEEKVVSISEPMELMPKNKKYYLSYTVNDDNKFLYIDIASESNLEIYDTYCFNIYELAHKCKEWALDYVDNIGSGFDKNKVNTYWCICNNGEIQHYDKSEPEAVFKACQWILEDKENK